MSFTVIDKRGTKSDHDKASSNRKKFLDRIKDAVQEQLPNIIAKRTLKNMDTAGAKIRVSRKMISEPSYHHGPGGDVDYVASGNREYVPGDTIPKPDEDSGSGGRKAGQGTSEDDVVVELSREEFMKAFFNDLELPNLEETSISKLHRVETHSAGYTSDGTPCKLAVKKSYELSLARRLAAKAVIREEIATAEEAGTEVELEELRARMSRIPLFEDHDLKYHATVSVKTPISHATMVMIMDVSGSMGEHEKTVAKKFFWLQYAFLRSQYDAVDMIFIAHTDTAYRLSEEEFFSNRISGGTKVSAALDMAAEITHPELAGKTNVYVSQVSDGDNYEIDNGTCAEILEDDILPEARYFAYIQVSEDSRWGERGDDGLWRSYNGVASRNKKLQIRRVSQQNEIYAVFRELFKKKGLAEHG